MQHGDGFQTEGFGQGGSEGHTYGNVKSGFENLSEQLWPYRYFVFLGLALVFCGGVYYANSGPVMVADTYSTGAAPARSQDSYLAKGNKKGGNSRLAFLHGVVAAVCLYPPVPATANPHARAHADTSVTLVV